MSFWTFCSRTISTKCPKHFNRYISFKWKSKYDVYFRFLVPTVFIYFRIIPLKTVYFNPELKIFSLKFEVRLLMNNRLFLNERIRVLHILEFKFKTYILYNSINGAIHCKKSICKESRNVYL